MKVYANGSATMGSNLSVSSKDETLVPPDPAIQGLAMNLREVLTHVYKETGVGSLWPSERNGQMQWFCLTMEHHTALDG